VPVNERGSLREVLLEVVHSALLRPFPSAQVRIGWLTSLVPLIAASTCW